MRSTILAVVALLVVAIPARAQSPSTAVTMTATGHIKKVSRGDEPGRFDYYFSFGETSKDRAQWVQLILVVDNPGGTPEAIAGVDRRGDEAEVSGVLLDISTQQPSGKPTVTTFLLVRSVKVPGDDPR